MRIEYKRDLESNYLVIEDTGLSGREFTLRMLEANAPEAFLKLSIKKMNGEASLWYRITSRQPLARIFERKSMSGTDILNLLRGLHRAMEDVRSLLLEPGDVALDPRWIYMDTATGRTWFIYLPGQEREERMELRGLAEFILRRLDHTDRDALDWGYGFYEQAAAGEAGFSQIWETLQRQKESRTGAGNDKAGAAEMETAYFREGKQPEPEAEVGLDERRLNREEGSEEKYMSRFRRWLPVVLAAAGLAVVYVLVLWLASPDITQAGGLFFGLAALGWLTGRQLGRRGKQDKDRANLRMDSAEEEQFWEALSREEDLQVADHTGKSFIPADHRAPEDPYGEPTDGSTPGEDLREETRFLGDMDKQDRLVLISQDVRRSRDLEVESVYCVIGKSREQADLCIGLNVISRVHAAIEQTQEGIFLTDLNSKNGTYVNRVRLNPFQKMPVSVGDIISFATVHFKLEQRDY